MYEFKITVEIPGLPEAINHLADALTAGRSPVVCNQNGENNHHIDNAGTVNINPAADKSVEAPVQENPTPADSGTTVRVSAPSAPSQTGAPSGETAEEKSYTLDDLSNAGAALIDQGKMPQLIELLGKYGVQAITQLDAGVYSAVAADLKALGAQL